MSAERRVVVTPEALELHERAFVIDLHTDSLIVARMLAGTFPGATFPPSRSSSWTGDMRTKKWRRSSEATSCGCSARTAVSLADPDAGWEVARKSARP